MHVTIKIAAVGDPPTFPELVPFEEVEVDGVSILEKGMASGSCSVAIHFTSADGKHFTAQLSSNMLLAIANAVRGAKERFHDTDF